MAQVAVFDEIARKRLVLVKQLYLRALVLSTAHHSLVDRIMSVVAFDLATETLMKAVVASLDPSRVPSDSFQGLVKQVDQLMVNGNGKSLPDQANIQFVHSIRNDAQHKARYPNKSEVSDCRTYTRDFLQRVVQVLWDIEFEKLSLADLVEHEKVREFLKNAEIALEESDHEGAVKQAATGLSWALERVQTAVVGRLPPFVSGIQVVDSFGSNKGHIPGRNVYQAVARMQRTLLYVTLGLSYDEYRRYEAVAGKVLFGGDGTPHFHGMKEDISAGDAEFIVAYCIDAVIQIEDCVGTLDKPFGAESWH